MDAPVNHIVGLTVIVRERVLPISGEVLARLNQKVTPTDIIAQTSWARDHVMIDVARVLKVNPAKADRMIKVKEGDTIKAGTELVASRGLFSSPIKAQRDGKVLVAGNGQILMEAGESKIELRAGMPGTVVELIPNRGAVIQTAGALIQGVWGNGRIETGGLVNLTEKPDSVLDAKRFDISMRGFIILGGMVKDAETLQAAADLPVRGMILSSLYPSLIQAARDMRYPIMVTDGFGAMPMNSVAYKLLTTNAKREVTLNAEMYDRYTGARPEAIITLPVTSDPPVSPAVVPFAPGLMVRMRRPPNMGMIGSIANIKPGLTELPSGLRAQVAEVKLENGENALVPLVNLEVVA
jgi:hypothetical protein